MTRDERAGALMQGPNHSKRAPNYTSDYFYLYARGNRILTHADGKADAEKYQHESGVGGHLAPEDEHAGGEARLELDGLAHAEQSNVAAASTTAAAVA